MQEGKLYKQVDEKHLYTEVDLMLWSPKMDLVAVTTMAGEVILHRLSWQKVWQLSQLKENVVVSSLVWRPDGKVLAIGYSNGVFKLCNVEKAQKMYEHTQCDHAITSLSWCDDKRYVHESSPDELSHYLKVDMNERFKDNSHTYLPELPSLTPKSSGNNKSHDMSLLKDQDGLNILLVGNAAGELEMFAFGFVPIAKIALPGTQPLKVLSAVLSARMNNLTVLLSEGRDSNLRLATFTCPKLNSSKEEIKFLAMKLGKLMELENYLSEVLKQMSEVYEDILFEFESKMRKYAEEKKQKNDRTLRTELLMFFLYGRASDDLKCFLQFELTKQSLARLGTSVQNSYSHIRNLIVLNLGPVCTNIVFQMEKMEGMSRVQNQFGKLGLCEKRVGANILHAINVAIKSEEMHQVIQDTVQKFDAFYRWLFPAKLRLSGESVPQGMGEWSNQDVNNVVDFITEYFKPDVRLERVGQYLKDEDLVNPIEDMNNLWKSFMEQASDSFKERTKDILPEIHSKFSLIQVIKTYQESLKGMINECSSCIEKFFQFHSSIAFVNSSNPKVSSSGLTERQFFVSSCTNELGTTSLAVLPRVMPLGCCFYLIKNIPSLNRVIVESVAIVNSDSKKLLETVDVEFYDDKTLCVLVHDEDDGQPRGSSKIVHLSLTELDNSSPVGESLIATAIGKSFIKDLLKLPQKKLSTDLIRDDIIKVVERSQASQFAVSGKRKVACVLYSSRKRVRLFLTEWEDDGDVSAAMQVDETAITLDEAEDVDSTLRVSDITIDSPDDNDKENSAVL